ncbi:MAG: hypothetical protein HY537_04160 [Deltaproteobacteria bacterium]|nr:hypothetical protein [Deltaproteobacteria bacterium]
MQNEKTRNDPKNVIARPEGPKQCPLVVRICMVSLAVLLTAVLTRLLLFDTVFAYPGSDLNETLPILQQIKNQLLLKQDLFYGIPSYNSLFHSMLISADQWNVLPQALFVLVLLSHCLVILSFLFLVTSKIREQSGIEVFLFLIAISAAFGEHLFGIDIVSPAFHPQSPAYAFLIFSLVSKLVLNNIGLCYLSAIGCAFFHPLLGIYNLGLIFLTVSFSKHKKKEILGVLGLSLLIYLLLVRPTLSRVGIHAQPSVMKTYSNILLYARIPHHLLPASWSADYLVKCATVALLGLYFSAKVSREIFFCYLFVFAIILIGVLNNSFVGIPSIIFANPLKMGAVLLFFFWVSMTVFFFNTQKTYHHLLILVLVFTWIQYRYPLPEYRRYFSLSILSLLSCYAIMHHHRKVVKPAFIVMALCFLALVPWKYLCQTLIRQIESSKEWRDLCRKTASVVPPDSLVIVSPAIEDFQLCTLRPTFVDFKHFPYDPSRALEWYRRLSLLGVFPRYSENELHHMKRLIPFNPERYHRLSFREVLAIKKRYPISGFMVTEATQTFPFEVLVENSKYKLYRLPTF